MSDTKVLKLAKDYDLDLADANAVLKLADKHDVFPAEAVVLWHEQEAGGNVALKAEQLRSQRVGLAAINAETPVRNVPGGDIANPNPNAAVTVDDRLNALVGDVVAFLRENPDQAEVLLERLDETLPDEVRDRVEAARAAQSDGAFNTNDLDTNADNQIGDDDLRKANVDQLVRFVEEYPDQLVRVVALEREKGDKGRRTLYERLGEPVPEELS